MDRDFWLADMDDDGLVDVVSADHTAHRGVWHKNPGVGEGKVEVTVDLQLVPE